MDIKLALRLEHDEEQSGEGCRLVKCKRCGKEIYTIGRKCLCKECQRKKNKKKLLDEQYRLASRLGLLKK